ncbi:hypothetical protein ACWIUA_04295 [Ursidibacter sp. B-7004-1]
MKKTLSILSLSFILSGCFDEPKKEMASTTPAEKSEQIVDSTEKVATSVENVVEKDQKTEMPSAKDEKTTAVALNDENKASMDITKSEDKTSKEIAKSETPAVAKKSEDSDNNQKVSITENSTRDKNVDSQKTLASTQDSKKAEKNTQRKISNSDTLSNTPLPKAEARKVTINTNVIEQQDSGLSAEEIRVGYQRVLSDSEITYLKSQCRYAFMSEKEVLQYNCAAKKVIIK